MYRLEFGDGAVQGVDLGFSGSRVLERLLASCGEVVSRDELLAYAWQSRVVSQGSLNQQIYTLRQCLSDDANRIIQTLPRRGYLFNPQFLEVEPAPEPAAAAIAAEARTAPAEPPRTETVAPQRRRTRRWLTGVAAAMLVAAGMLGYGRLPPPVAGSVTHSLDLGPLHVLYVESTDRLLQALVADTRSLVQDIAQLTDKPARLIVNMSPGFYEIRCLQPDGSINWLKVHKSRLNSVADEQLQGCLK
ncbi:winged helix-turn-helix domain-containing protein [Stutzerimonas nosocomialis]|uniref:winged helix-turn-helix domain-containing protein n=1 Tax=Stutzerimonas nosocomialis TaxID=1056496 RepID=UPI001F4F5EAD|nr:winged helix-turn-helix domain-containing protein [Stutzerimonas nosocomialis]